MKSIIDALLRRVMRFRTMTRGTGSDGRDQLLSYLNRDLSDNREFLKRRYLWLTVALLQHSADMTELLSRDLHAGGWNQLTAREMTIVRFEIFIGSYSIAMSTADRVVQSKTRLTANACRHISEDPIGITLQFCEEKFKDLGLDFGAMFDVYAGYQVMHQLQSKEGKDSVQGSAVTDKLQKDLKQFFGIGFTAESVAQHFTNRVKRRVPQVDERLVLAFAQSNLVAPAVIFALDGFHLEQEKIDGVVLQFLQGT